MNALLKRELVQVDVVFRRGNEIDQLAELSLKGSLKEEFHQVDIVFLAPEVLLEEIIDGGFKHESVVDSNVTDVGLESFMSPLTQI